MIDLQVLSPQGSIFSDSVDAIVLPTDKGEIEVLENHAPLYSRLTEGIIEIKKGSKNTRIAVTGGFIEVKNNNVSILSDYAIPAESIQVARAQEAKKKAEELIEKHESDMDILVAEKELQKSIMELKVAEKIKNRQ